jgi:hypothetical protein
VNVVLILLPRVVTAVMITTAISAAISAYSIAVTPESSWAKFFTDLNIGLLLLQTPISGQLRFLLPASTQHIHTRFHSG